MFEIGKLVRLDLGYQGENKARTIEIDMSAWLDEFPGAAVGLMVRRPDEDTFYPAALTHDGDIVRWTITSGDVEIAGEGEAQIILTNEDDVQLRSRVVKTKISASLSGTEVEAPPPETTFVTQVINAAAKAEAAVEKMPSIGENGNWYGWDAEAGAYVDTGKPSKGKDGEDGYTPIKGKDYFDGEPGYTPQKGVDYFDGEDGEDGYTPIKGKDYFDGNPGYTPVKGKDYFDGEDGVSPSVEVTPITDGHRVTITDANGSKSFDVMNGKDGELTGDVPAGAAGGYYTPAVSSAGLLSWTPSKSDMPAVPSADIKGPKGDDGAPGYTPQKGVDYYTEADKAELVEEVKEQVGAEGGDCAPAIHADQHRHIDTLTWDGDKTGKTVVTSTQYSNVFVHVSDIVPALEELIDKAYCAQEYEGEYNEGLVTEDGFFIDEGKFWQVEGLFAVVAEDNYVRNTHTFPKKGIYFEEDEGNESYRTISLKIPGYNFSGSTDPITPEMISAAQVNHAYEYPKYGAASETKYGHAKAYTQHRVSDDGYTMLDPDGNAFRYNEPSGYFMDMCLLSLVCIVFQTTDEEHDKQIDDTLTLLSFLIERVEQLEQDVAALKGGS